VYATYNMAKHFEEAGRKLLLPHLDAGEAAVGRSLSVEHLAPSRVGDTVRITARCVGVERGRVTCTCTATGADGTEVGRGSTVQVVLPAHVLDARLGRPPR
jgi:predicted thioesterase